MSLIPETGFPTYSSQAVSTQELQNLLQNLLRETSAAGACVFEYGGDFHSRDPFTTASLAPLEDDEQQRLFRFMREHTDAVRSANGSKPPSLVLGKDQLERTSFHSAVLFPLSSAERQHGVLALFFSEEAFSLPDLLQKVTLPLQTVALILENDYLKGLLEQNLATAQSILATAQAIAESPSPQNVVDILHDYLFDAHISSCALLLFGPNREDTPHGPFEYLEIKGTWSKRLGSGVGIGVRLYLKENADLLALLEQEKVLTLTNATEIRNRFDPLIRGFVRAERVRSLMLLMLQSASRKLGVIAIATDKPHEFTTREIHSYQTVAEFLAISAMAQTLQQQHDRVQQGRAALLDAVTDGVVMVLPHGHGGHVLTVNQRFTRQFEVPESHAQGLTLMELLDQMEIPEGTRHDLRTDWSSTPVVAPTIKRGEFHMISGQGEPVDIEWYSAPVYQDQHVLGRIYIFHDITAERTAARLRAEFLSRVSHELRTPLTSIHGFAEFILEATGDKLPDLAHEYTQIILKSAKQLKTIFDEMIQITRADAGQLRLNKEDAHLPDLIIDVGAQMELQYKQRKQQLVLDLDDDLPPVNIDATKIAQVLTNLLTNAIKYSPDGGTLRVSTQFANSIDELPEDAPKDVVLPAILVSIADEGKGLTKEEAEQVFLPFFRTEEAKKNKIEGVGLGLAVTRSIVEIHRGKIWAVPRPRASGGCFQFTLPTVRQ